MDKVETVLSKINLKRKRDFSDIRKFFEEDDITVVQFASTIVRLYEEGRLKEFSERITAVYVNIPIDISLAICELVPEHIRNDAGIWQ